MSNFLDIFGIYDFVTRDSLILLLVALSAYVLLNAGLFAVPQVGFMAIGAYAAGALSTEYRAPLLLTLTSAGLLAAFAGGVLALLLSRLNGTYLAIATIGFGEIVRVVARNLDFTGGALGLRDVQRSLNDVVIVGAVIVAMVLLGRFNATRFGRAVEAIREDPLMTAHQGVSVARYRLGLFVLSGLLAGLAGGMHAHLGGFVQPGYFDFSLLTAILAAVVLGGMTSVYGPLLGGLVIFAAPQVFREVANYRNLLNGTLIILVIAVAPLGLAELIRRPFGWLVRERNSSADQRLSKAWTGEVSPGKIVQLGSSLDGAVPAPRKALAVESISKKFGGVTALRDVSLDVSYGEILGLIGPNGSGKTTLLNLLSGVYRPDSGTIRISGEFVQKRFGRPEQLARADVARTFQSIRLVSEWTVRENVLIGMYLRQHAGLPASIVGLRAARREAVQCREETNETLHRLGLSDVADTMAGSLPYGLQRRVEIARALVRHPALLLLDEPTAGMTPAERDDIFSLVREVSVPEIAIIVVEHDVASITNTCGKIAVLNFGQLIAYGSAADVIQEEVVVDAYIGRRS